MSNLKEIRTRIASVSSTRQITSAMKMVAAAKLRRAQDAIIQLRPYANKLHEVLANLSSSVEARQENEYGSKVEISNVLIVVMTSNKGLCGAFNSNIVKAAINLAETKYQKQLSRRKLVFYTIGKKGNDLLKSKKYNIGQSNNVILDHLSFDNAAKIAESLMKSYIKNEYDVIELVYNQFKNAAVQILTIEQFLPIEIKNDKNQSGIQDDYILEPSKQYIIKKLIPKALKTQLFKCLLDSITSEHGARMTSMHQATDNATDMLRELRLNYNKARQSAITNELIEIVSGAEALKS